MREKESIEQFKEVAEKDSDELKKLRFQNYTPRTEDLKKCKQQPWSSILRRDRGD